MQIQLEVAALVTLILTVLASIVAITRYVTQLQFKMRQENLEVEKERLERKYLDLDAKYRDLAGEITKAKMVGTAILMKKMEIDQDLASVMNVMRAQAGSVFIPLRSQSSTEPLGLVFLSIQPFDAKAKSLKRRIIPLQSLAGRCYGTGIPYVVSNSKQDPEHYDKADRVSGFYTEDVLSYPLRCQGEIIGVLQLLNKQGPDRFSDDDIANVEPFAQALAVKVMDLVQDPDTLEILGITPDRKAEYATVMFCDLTHSAILFQEMGTPAAIQHINEYFEKICDIAFDYGATVDKYIGDGVIFRFNVPRPLKDHHLRAVEAALQMRASFEKLKQDWIAIGDLVSSMFLRVGIAYGLVHQALIGHPQYQYITILGQPMNIAANLCEAAPRNKNVIVIDEELYKMLSSRLSVEQLPKEKLGKAIAYIQSAYELHGLK